MEFSAGVWTDVTSELVGGIRFTYGIQSSRPTDRVANVGTLLLTLKNKGANAGNVSGYYAPLHANVRSGFDYGLGVRVLIGDGTDEQYKWRGKISHINVRPGHGLVTDVIANDWMDELVEFDAVSLEIQEIKRADQLLTTLLAAMPEQPAATDFETGVGLFPLAFHDVSRVSGRTAAEHIAMSELGWIGLQGDDTQGGTLFFHNRHHNFNQASSYTLTDTMHGLDLTPDLDNLGNLIRVTVHPHHVDTSSVIVLYTLPDLLRIQPGGSRTFFADYFDPVTQEPIGGSSMITPVAGTDYVASSVADGTGTDLTDFLSVTPSFFGSAWKCVLTNTGTQPLTVTLLQVRGYRVDDPGQTTQEAEDTTSRDAYGRRIIEIDMPYESDRNIGDGLAAMLLDQYADLKAQTTAVRFLAQYSTTHLTQAIQREPGDIVVLTESTTGLTAVPVRINAVSFDVQDNLWWVTWTIAPLASTLNYLRLDDATYGVLDAAEAILGYA